MIAGGLWLPERALRPFRSVRFNIALFAVIAAAAVAGTFWPALNVYHSAWFSALLALMAFDVVACKLRRGPPLVMGRPRRPLERSLDRLFAQSRFRVSVASSRNAADTAATVRTWMAEWGLHVTEEPVRSGDDDMALGFFGARHRIQRWGDMVLHVSIVAMLAGGLMGALFGFDEMLPIVEGQTAHLKNRPMAVTLEDFDMQYYAATGEVSRYASQITVREKGEDVGRKRILVNDPLDIGRVRFYQASWGMTPEFRSAILRIGGHDIPVRPGEVVPLAADLSVRANRMAPTLKIDGGRAVIADYHGRNPALQVDLLEKGQVRVSVWLMYNRAEAFRVEGDRVVAAPPPPFTWVAFEPTLFSGIQVGYDPGAPLFWTGAIALMIGLCAHFYLHQKRVRVAVVPTATGSDIRVGGWNSRTVSEFEPEFEEWVERLRLRVS